MVHLTSDDGRAQRIDQNGVRWILVDVPGVEGRHGHTSPSDSVKSRWWAQWNDLSLVPSKVDGPESAHERVNEWLTKGDAGRSSSEEYRKARFYRWKLSAYRRHLCEVLPLRESREQRMGPSYISGGVVEGSTHALIEGRFTAARRAAMNTSADMSGLPTARMVSPSCVRGRVTVVCPTSPSRHHLHPNVYSYFVDQDWPDKELIVLDTGGDPSPFFTEGPRELASLCFDGMPGGSPRAPLRSPLEDPRVWYVHVREYPLTLGDKRNQLIQLSSGEIVAHFDDDNIYAPEYLTAMVKELRASNAQLVSLSATFAWTPSINTLRWHDDRVWGRAETIVHLRGPLNVMAFASAGISEEAPFLAASVARGVLDTFGVFVHINHGGNISSYEHDFEKKRQGEPLLVDHLPSPRLRALLSKHPMNRVAAVG